MIKVNLSMPAALLLIMCVRAALADPPVYFDIPQDCSNENLIFTKSSPPFKVEPTWVERCDNFCRDGLNHGTVFFPTAICSGTLISRPVCVKDELHAGCSKIVVNSGVPPEKDCAENGSGLRCEDRPVKLYCSFSDPERRELAAFAKDVSHAFCTSGADSADPARGENSIFWLMDWSDYGPAPSGACNLPMAEQLRMAGGLPDFDIENIPRFYWERMPDSVQSREIPAGPHFFLYSPGSPTWPHFRFGQNSCTVRDLEFKTKGRLARVECPLGDIPEYYFSDPALVPADKRFRLLPDESESLISPGYDMAKQFGYESFAVQFWKTAGLDLSSGQLEQKSFLSECAAIAEKVQFARGYFLHEKLKLDFDGLIEQTGRSVENLAASRELRGCRDLGRGIQCASRNADCGGGWGRYWNAFGEFSVRRIINAKYRAAISDGRIADRQFVESMIGRPNFMVPVYLIDHPIWGAAKHGQLNKVGRIWQFLLNPVSVD